MSAMEIGQPPATKFPWGDGATPYEQLGGDGAVRALVDVFYDEVEATSPVLRKMLPADMSGSRQKLYEFLSGWTGGPPLYWERRGHPALRLRHSPFTIGEFEAAEWARCMRRAIVVSGIRDPLAEFLGSELGRAAVQLRNSENRPTIDDGRHR
jgi:hemoglobin